MSPSLIQADPIQADAACLVRARLARLWDFDLDFERAVDFGFDFIFAI
jgi:hypothetical protein